MGVATRDVIEGTTRTVYPRLRTTSVAAKLALVTPLSLKNGKSKNTGNEIKKISRISCVRRRLWALLDRSTTYAYVTHASCRDRDSSVKHVLYCGRLFHFYTDLQ